MFLPTSLGLLAAMFGMFPARDAVRLTAYVGAYWQAVFAVGAAARLAAAGAAGAAARDWPALTWRWRATGAGAVAGVRGVRDRVRNALGADVLTAGDERMRSRVAAGAFVGALVGVAFGLPAATIVAEWMRASPVASLLAAWAASALAWAMLGGVAAYFIPPSSGPDG